MSDIIDRLKASGEATVRATALIADAKSKRNQAAGDEAAAYTGLKFEETMEALAIKQIERMRWALGEIAKHGDASSRQVALSALNQQNVSVTSEPK